MVFQAVRADVYHVDVNATSPGGGATWCTAFDDLQDALAVAGAGDEIRIADGTYTPDSGTGDVLASFEVPSGVKLLGGYAGCGAATPNARDPETFETVLSGDLAGDDGPGFANNGENSFVVVRTSQASASTLLDGLTISGGNADGPLYLYDRGGGMYNFLGGPTIRGCTFRANSGTAGGAMMNDASDAVIDDCRFEENEGIGGGGGIYSYNSEVSVRHTLFTANSTIAGPGGAVYAYNSVISLDDCDFYDHASYAQGAVALYTNTQATVHNCVFDNNVGGALSVNTAAHSVIEGCTFNNNHGTSGAALFVFASIVMRSSTLSGNVATGNGGAVYMVNGDFTAEDCAFTGNTSMGGAGGAVIMQTDSPASFRRCTFEGNSAERGGAAYAFNTSPVDFIRCTFIANTATQDDGGGLYAGTDAIVRLAGCRILGNTTSGSGGGVYLGSYGSLLATSIYFSGNQAAENGGGAYVGFNSTTRFANCTFTRNQAPSGRGGIYNSGGVLLVDNSVLWNNGGLQSFSQIDGSTPQVNYSCVPGSWGGVGNIAMDPIFVDADGLDDAPGTRDDSARLAHFSPCVDQGDLSRIPGDHGDADLDGNAVEPTPIDVEGHARVLCGAVDIGASEEGIGDVDCDGIVDLSDFAMWAACMTGPDAGPYAAGCEVFDFEYDGDVDARDHAGWQREITVP